ncbi:hypothetical protein P168DRAFT_75545 [Aspergillus campestris IBT 28561]|uniref:Secreted protein n=1 Tax=Aspergillus campestris (strain IBT 28561) TaxID=1392248 RepID=A0A2I1CRN0_ASPC2|nr:uncharacterized protein P168DRAFT_75545 [Aspergillus campestris IBT 28561]PKY00284.1 hypothetical protein P168DRAFT_75545 [Aspergillus campestris IBT 28561]
MQLPLSIYLSFLSVSLCLSVSLRVSLFQVDHPAHRILNPQSKQWRSLKLQIHPSKKQPVQGNRPSDWPSRSTHYPITISPSTP